MKKIVIFALALVAFAGFAGAMGSKEGGAALGPATAVKYFVAHQGGYIGEAVVTVNPDGSVKSAELHEWQGPGGWAENNSADGKSIVDGAVVRVPDPLANPTHADPEIKGYMFYIYNVKDGLGIWSQYTPGKDAFGRPTRQYERDFEGLMGNPIRAAAYVAAAKADKLVNVTIDGLKVTVGKKASETVHYGHMDKSNPKATYMPIGAATIGYRYNMKATVDFFMANPLAPFADAVAKAKTPLRIVADKAVDLADAAAFTAADDSVFFLADAVTGATFSDFPHYALELQAAYKLALAQQLINSRK
ncbi:MAG: hypothetical protein JXA15_10040 [Spirochaetales bacterium]|nr:hypothetical protein [Spirochaetales bacterium]